MPRWGGRQCFWWGCESCLCSKHTQIEVRLTQLRDVMGSWCGRPKQALIRNPGAVFLCSSLSRTPRHCTFGGEEMILPSQHIYIFVATQGYLCRAGRPMVNASAECGHLNICIRSFLSTNSLTLQNSPASVPPSSSSDSSVVMTRYCWSWVARQQILNSSQDFKCMSRSMFKPCPSSPCPGLHWLQTDLITDISGIWHPFLEPERNTYCVKPRILQHCSKHKIHIAKKWHNNAASLKCLQFHWRFHYESAGKFTIKNSAKPSHVLKVSFAFH